jgi:hypothetical protein
MSLGGRTAGRERRGGRTTGTGWDPGARMVEPAMSTVIGWLGHRHRPGRTGLRLHDAKLPFPSSKARKVQDFVR